MARPVRLRALAATDLDDAAEYYRQHAGEQIAIDFIDAVERGIRELGRRPQIGSLRFAYELEIPDLRASAISRFPYIVFYVDADDVVDVWRVLHTRRDFPTTPREPTS